MTHTLTAKPLTAVAFVMLLGLAAIVGAPHAFAADHAAPIQPATPAYGAPATSSSGAPAFSSSGEPVMTGAWCDPTGQSCEQHPWTQHHRL